MTDFHDVVEMLINRMKDYPEDFVAQPNSYDIKQTKWQKALSIVQGVATPQERDALDIRLEEAQRAVYMGAALKTILSDESEEKEKVDPRVFKGFGQAPIKAEGGLIGYDTQRYMMEMEQRMKELEARKQKEYALNVYANTHPTGSTLR